MNQDELNLINLAKNGDSDSIKKLIAKHSGIYVSTCKKYTSMMCSSGILKDHIDSSKDYIIYNSAKTFNPSVGSKFSTWISNQARYFCLNTINKNKNYTQGDEDSIKLSLDSKAHEKAKEEIIKEKKQEYLTDIKNILKNLSNKKIKKCIEKKYFSEQNKTYTEIAKEMNVTVQTVINWHNKFIKLAKQKINKN
jgi:RNA polymerase sigma factor (sigma-70 family)